MKQSRGHSVLEALTNTVAGYLVAVGSRVAVLPLFGLAVPLRQSFTLGGVFALRVDAAKLCPAADLRGGAGATDG